MIGSGKVIRFNTNPLWCVHFSSGYHCSAAHCSISVFLHVHGPSCANLIKFGFNFIWALRDKLGASAKLQRLKDRRPPIVSCFRSALRTPLQEFRIPERPFSIWSDEYSCQEFGYLEIFLFWIALRMLWVVGLRCEYRKPKRFEGGLPFLFP